MTPKPTDMMRLGFETTRLAIEANSVIWLRTLGMAGVWNTPFDESYRMVAEKHGAFLKASGDAVAGLVQGRNPVDVARPAVATLDDTTSRNRQRLSARGRRKSVL